MFDIVEYAKKNKVAVLIVPQVTKDAMITVSHAVLYEDGKVTMKAAKTEEVKDGDYQRALDTAVARLGRGKAFAIGADYTSMQLREREKFFRGE